VLYGIVGVIALVYYRRRFFRLRGFTSGIVKAAGSAVVMVVLDVLGDLVEAQLAKALLGILEDSCEALAVSYFFWTFVTARFQLRRPGEYLCADSSAASPASVAPSMDR
jgi:L-alanine-DL-glutamate epimerase-like enolase superfamily enzyme